MIPARIGPSLTIALNCAAAAGGNIAADIKAKAASDGYTIMMGTIRTHAVNYSLYSKLPYHPVRDFTSIALAGENPNALDVHPRVAANTIQELIASTLARPGVLNFGSSGRVPRSISRVD